MRLNPEQQQAVEALEGPLLVTAGAGSGKTRVLTERFAHAVELAGDESAAMAQALVAITFTDKAAGELAERIRGALRARGLRQAARRIDGAWISTIHGLCARLLRQNALEAGIDPQFRVADAVTAGSLKEEAFAVVAKAALAARESARELFAAYDFASVAAAVELVARELRSRGLRVGALMPERVSDPRAVHSRAVALFDRLQEEFGRCQQSTSVAAHVQACADRAEALRRIGEAVTPAHNLAVETWNALQNYGAALRGTKESAPILEELKRERAALVAEAAACAAQPFSEEISRLVGEYEVSYRAMKAARATLDFDDLQSFTLHLLESRPELARAYRGAFELVMVDEFQDTDVLQLAIVEALAAENLCTVGDERQSIYSFRGADVEAYRAHISRMEAMEAKRVALERNYRSHPDVLGFVNALFSRPELFGHELLRLVAEREEPDAPVVPADKPRVVALLVAKGENADAARATEAEAIAERFSELQDGTKLRAGDMVVLVRSYSHAEAYAQALRARGISAVIMGGSRFFSLAEVKLGRALVRAIANPEDDEALAAVMASRLGRVSDEGLWRLTNEPDRREGSLWQAVADRMGELGEADAQAVRRVADALTRAQGSVGDEPMSAILLRALEDLDFDLVLMGEGDEGRQTFANVLKLARLADAFEAAGGAGPAGFSAYLDAKEAFGDHESPAAVTDEDVDAVRIMSIHAAKGLEFPVVAVPGLSATNRSEARIARVGFDDGGLVMAVQLPKAWETGGKDASLSRQSPQFRLLAERGDALDTDERKRLFYVACTRAKEVLILSGELKEDGTAADDSMLAWLLAAVEAAPSDEPSEGRRAALLGGARVEVARVGARAPEVTPGPAPRIASGPTVECAAPSVRPVEAAREPGPLAAGSEPAMSLPPSLSYSDLALFAECPRRFFAERIVRVRRPRAPQAGAADALSFGSAVHAALDVGGGCEPPGERLDAIARSFSLDAAQRSALGEAVATYARSDVATREREFDSTRREMPFSVQVGQRAAGFVLSGTVDAYSTKGSRALIVDYKTGESGDAAELEERYRLQSRCYALAALLDGRESVEVVFVRVQAVAADGQPQTVRYAFTSAELAKIETDLLGRYSAIATSPFEPLAEWTPRSCTECPIAAGICPRHPAEGCS